ncbi:VWA domain-containing protein [Amycolatopsis thermoflava]|uniref:VWA domain-containing protein n=1 Tax=Amycolatopsis thermoflava TaxID=84480 RepID=UPI0036587C4F
MAGKTVSKLRELSQRAGRWLGLAETAAAPKHTGAIVADRFDTMAWRETYDQAGALRILAEDLNQSYDHTTDLLADTFLGAYKASPQVREATEMDPSRAVNHQVISTMMGSPQFAELRRETAGDSYAAAMAVLSQGEGLRSMLERAQDAHEKAQAQAEAQRQAAEAAQAVADALETAGAVADDDGTVPDEQAEAVQRAIAAAQAAEQAAAAAAAGTEQALAAALPSVRAAARQAITQATENAREEAALMRAWGVGPGQLERMDFDTRAQLAQRLHTGRLAQFAQLIGRFRQMATGERARRVENAPGELVGITLGDDLGRVIPSELSQLGVPALRPVFASKYAEARLMLYDSRGEQVTGQGAIIACIDCSGSMAGHREAWAKACALALLDQARQAKRDFVGILFSSAEQVRTFRFPAATYDIAAVIEFAEHFFNGGTDFQAPLGHAAELLEAEFNAEGRARGDIVLITDGHCDVHEDWMREWNEAKAALDFRTFGISIGDHGRATTPGSVLDALCDNLRSIDDLTDTDAAADLFRVI